MLDKVLCKGAEAELIETVFLGNKALLKKRVQKEYRVKQLDENIRKERTKQEAILLHRAKELGVRTPVIYQIDKNSITMEFVDGARLKGVLDKKNFFLHCKKLSEKIALLHNGGLIHGDLTTSNVIVNPKSGLVLVDFGLGFFSEKIEDRAVDLLNLKKTFEATHHLLMPNAWNAITKNYAIFAANGAKVVEQIGEIEKRARYY